MSQMYTIYAKKIISFQIANLRVLKIGYRILAATWFFIFENDCGETELSWQGKKCCFKCFHLRISKILWSQTFHNDGIMDLVTFVQIQTFATSRVMCYRLGRILFFVLFLVQNFLSFSFDYSINYEDLANFLNIHFC